MPRLIFQARSDEREPRGSAGELGDVAEVVLTLLRSIAEGFCGRQRPGKRPQRHVPSWRSLDGQRARGIKPPRKTEAPPKKTTAKGRRLMGDFVSDDEFAKRLLAWFGNISRVLQPGRSFYLWGGYANIANYPPALVASDLFMSQCLIWV